MRPGSRDPRRGAGRPVRRFATSSPRTRSMPAAAERQRRSCASRSPASTSAATATFVPYRRAAWAGPPAATHTPLTRCVSLDQTVTMSDARSDSDPQRAAAGAEPTIRLRQTGRQRLSASPTAPTTTDRAARSSSPARSSRRSWHRRWLAMYPGPLRHLPQGRARSALSAAATRAAFRSSSRQASPYTRLA